MQTQNEVNTRNNPQVHITSHSLPYPHTVVVYIGPPPLDVFYDAKIWNQKIIYLPSPPSKTIEWKSYK